VKELLKNLSTNGSQRQMMANVQKISPRSLLGFLPRSPSEDHRAFWTQLRHVAPWAKAFVQNAFRTLGAVAGHQAE
jgi:hypothetical protein